MTQKFQPGYHTEEYAQSIEQKETYWAEQASELSWYKKWDIVLDDTKFPFNKWFSGGKINIVANAIDRHLRTEKKNKIALLWEGENGDERSLSYFELGREVTALANILKNKGAKKGSTVAIYMPPTPDLVVAMLACAKIGAIHTVIYGGFSSEALASRIEDAKTEILITADGTYRRGKTIELKAIANEAMSRAKIIKTCLVFERTKHSVEMVAGRDHFVSHLKKDETVFNHLDTEITDAEDPLFILYTSGSTGKPKGLLHTHGGYAVYTSVTHRTVFDIQDSDRYWCTADPGWITGHSYLTYGPLINGTTVFMYEGAPNFPEPDRFWKLIQKYGITIFYTSPTAIRGLMRFGDEWPARHDLSSLRLLGSVGEPINPEAWQWFHKEIGKEKCPIMDTWWQTETGGFVITPLPSTPLKPGSATFPFFGHKVAVVDDFGIEVEVNKEGSLVIQTPWPGQARTIWGDNERFKETYYKKYEAQKWYYTGDSAKKDSDGYFWIIGRQDDVIKVSGYRLGTAEVESALVSHAAVAEAAAIGLPHELKGNAIHCYVLLRESAKNQLKSELVQELKDHVAKEMGAIARPEEITIVDQLPKTRSGKIMRRVLKARALGQDVGDTSTLEE